MGVDIYTLHSGMSYESCILVCNTGCIAISYVLEADKETVERFMEKVEVTSNGFVDIRNYSPKEIQSKFEDFMRKEELRKKWNKKRTDELVKTLQNMK